MHASHHRQRDMALRMKDFAANNPAPPDSVGAQLAARLNTVLVELDQLVAAEGSKDGLARESTDTSEIAREDLEEEVRAIARTAQAIEHQVPGFAEKFRLPKGDSDQDWIDTGLTFAADAASESARFISFGMDADFIEQLQNRVAALRASITTRSTNVAERKATRELIEDKLDEIMRVRREYDAYVRNVHRDDPRVLSEWTSAKHIQRAPKRKAGPSSGGSTPSHGGTTGSAPSTPGG